MELGTDSGESYFGLCQAVSENIVNCECYAVDRWAGDGNTEPYDHGVFGNISHYNARHYASFSNLLRMTFDEASALFFNESVDLLHIRGCHAYCAVKHHFESWLPKMSTGGLILIDDIAVEGTKFDGWRFWAEIASQFPSFAFLHSSGLGLLANGRVRDKHPLLSALFNGGSDPQTVRDYYYLCAQSLSDQPLPKPAETSKFRVYSPDSTGYSEARSVIAETLPNEWLTLDLEVPFPSGRLRVDPTDRRSLVEVSEIEIRHSVSNDLLWRLDPTMDELDYGGTAVQVPSESPLTILSFGVDPQLYLPNFEVPDRAATLRIHCRLRVDPDFHSSPAVLEHCSAAIFELGQSVEQLKRKYEEQKALYLQESAAKQQTLEEENARLLEQTQRQSELSLQWAAKQQALEEENARLLEQTQRQSELSLQRAAKQQTLEDENARLQKLVAGVTSDLAAQARRYNRESQLWASRQQHVERERTALQISLQAEGRRAEERLRNLNAIRSSFSWQITSPLRAVGTLVLKAHELFLKCLYQSSAFVITGKIIAKAVSGGYFPLGRFFLPSNPLFSPQFYASSNPDLSRSRNLWGHYIGFGADEGRDPHPLFNTRYYTVNNPDVVRRRLNPLIHYYAFGANENRQPHPEFDPVEYLRERHDVAENRVNPLLHYWQYGRYDIPSTVLRPSVTHEQANPGASRQCSGSDAATTVVPNGPLFSIVMPVFNTAAGVLRQAIESVRRQSYSKWQLCIYDDGSDRTETASILKEYIELQDARIEIEFGATTQGIAKASNAASVLARGDYIGFLDHDDELDCDALLEIAKALERNPTLDAVYTDQDTINADGHRIGTLLKPDWSPELFRGVMFVNHLLVVRAELFRELGGFDSRFERIQDFEFMLRVSEKTDKVGHIPRILYHWRAVPGSVASATNAKGPLEPVQASAVNAHLQRLGIGAIAIPHPSLPHRMTIRAISRSTHPRVIIAVRDTPEPSTFAVHSIVERSSYPNFLVAVSPVVSRALPDDPRIYVANLEEVHRRLDAHDFLIWIDADLEIVEKDWIETLLIYCEQPDVGCASPLILLGETVWCSGLVLGVDHGLGYSMRGRPPRSDGYAGSLSCAREVSSVSGECLMVSARLFQQSGGNVKYFSTSVFDGADLSLRARALGRRNIVTPQAIVRRRIEPAAPIGCKLDADLFSDRWHSLVQEGDPYYISKYVPQIPVCSQVLATAHA